MNHKVSGHKYVEAFSQELITPMRHRALDSITSGRLIDTLERLSVPQKKLATEISRGVRRSAGRASLRRTQAAQKIEGRRNG
jgi:hypothetical protein